MEVYWLKTMPPPNPTQFSVRRVPMLLSIGIHCIHPLKIDPLCIIWSDLGCLSIHQTLWSLRSNLPYGGVEEPLWSERKHPAVSWGRVCVCPCLCVPLRGDLEGVRQCPLKKPRRWFLLIRPTIDHRAPAAPFSWQLVPVAWQRGVIFPTVAGEHHHQMAGLDHWLSAWMWITNLTLFTGSHWVWMGKGGNLHWNIALSLHLPMILPNNSNILITSHSKGMLDASVTCYGGIGKTWEGLWWNGSCSQQCVCVCEWEERHDGFRILILFLH